MPPSPLALLIALIALADLLFWGHEAGLSLGLFALALYAAALKTRPRPLALAVLILGILPVIELVQPLSVTLLAAALLTSLALQARPGVPPLPLALALLAEMPVRAMADASHGLRKARPDALRGAAAAWALPLGGGLVLLSLLAQANPVLDGWLTALANWPTNPGAGLSRALFWTGAALVAWPLILSNPRLRQGPHRPRPRLNPAAFGINPASVARALILFNTGLALQGALDARFLWSGATPPGMTLAAYAHRGAYPLLATALLAGAFALAARPFTANKPVLRALLYLWLAQNVLLTLSALYRLDLYVQSYGLTYLRIHAAIWMALVAAGLALTAWQLARGLPNGWLLIRSAALGLATLYTCAFVNFADVIARTNIAMGKIDPLYLCQLGPTAAASVPRWAWNAEGLEYDLSSRGCTLTPPKAQTWRDWGFRNWRVLHSLATQEAPR